MNFPQFILGSAMWGWGISSKQTYDLLDSFAEALAGDYLIDGAWNYPIDKCPDHLGMGIKLLSQWLVSNKCGRAKCFIKLGAVTNSGTPDNDLSFNNLKRQLSEIQSLLGPNLWGVGVHWDNRSDQGEIEETIHFLQECKKQGLQIGLSGISVPEKYSLLSNNDLIIQVKENLTTCIARNNYEKFFPTARYWAYGINMGGISKQPTSITATATLRNISVTFEQIEKYDNYQKVFSSILSSDLSYFQTSLIYALMNKRLSGIIVGPKNKKQLEEILLTKKTILPYLKELRIHLNDMARKM